MASVHPTSTLRANQVQPAILPPLTAERPISSKVAYNPATVDSEALGGRRSSSDALGVPNAVLTSNGLQRAAQEAQRADAAGAAAPGGDPPADAAGGTPRTSLDLILRNISGHPSHVTSYDESPEARNERYAKLKMAALRIAEAMPATALRRQALEQCGKTLVYRWWLQSDRKKLHAAYFCGKPKLCPFCAHRRAVKLLASFQARLAVVIAERPKLVPILATFTVRNQAELLPVVKLLDRSFSALIERRQRQLKGKRTTKTCLVNIAGGVAMIEVTRSQAGWHPHLHVLMLREAWISQAELLAEWQAIVGDQAGVDLRAMHSVKAGADLRTPEGMEALGRDLVEVFKYALKFSSMEPADVIHAEKVLRNRRMARPFGCLWGVKEPQHLADDLEGESGPYLESIYRFVVERYVLESFRHGTTEEPLWEEWKP